MQLAMVGLGRMGADMVRRLLRSGHQCTVYDLNREAVENLAAEGAIGSESLEDLVAMLPSPRVVWVMVPAGAVGALIERLAGLLDAEDILIDGGNTHFRDDPGRAAHLARNRIRYVDVGISGGVWGLERGYCQMIGGEEHTVRHLEPLFRALAPPRDGVEPTPGRNPGGGTAPEGFLHCGPAGAGHFVKMIHNGIEYAHKAADAEGFQILRSAGGREGPNSVDPGSDGGGSGERFDYELDVAEIAELWRRGSVISSWLLDLTAQALSRDPDLTGFSGKVADSGEGRWTIRAAIDEGVPAHVLSAALFARFSSRGEGEFANKVLSAMRQAFGGHLEKP